LSDETIADDLKAAFEALESPQNAEKVQETVEEPTEEVVSDDLDTEQTAESDDSSEESDDSDEDAPKTAESDEKEPENAEKVVETPDEYAAPPAGYRALAREKWKDTPKEVREEAIRREREISTTLQQTTDIRKFAENFAQTIYPFRDHIKREGATPLSAVQGLLQTAASLQTGTQDAKAAQIAALVHRYGVDIGALDNALASGVGREEPQVMRAVQEAVRPYQEEIERQRALDAQRQQGTVSSVQQELTTFSSDPKNEFFQDVRLDMADIMDAEARRGKQITFKDAYERACKLNPEVATILDGRKAVEDASKRALLAKQKQRAAKSVSGSSGGEQRRRAALNPGDDLRADLEAAMSGV
jgi:hypothetical protein